MRQLITDKINMFMQQVPPEGERKKLCKDNRLVVHAWISKKDYLFVDHHCIAIDNGVNIIYYIKKKGERCSLHVVICNVHRFKVISQNLYDL